MNKGLFGLGMQPNQDDLVGFWLLPRKTKTGSQAQLSWPNPFTGPVLVQHVLYFAAAAHGFPKEALVYAEGATINAGTTDTGSRIEDCSQNIRLRPGGYYNLLNMAGAALDIAANASLQDTVMVVGRRGDLLRGIPSGQAIQRFYTGWVPFALSSLVQWDNPCGRQPKHMTASLRCRIPDAGFRPGDVVPMGAQGGQVTGGSNSRCTHYATPVKLNTRLGIAPSLGHRTTGTETAITASRWDIRCEILA